LEYRRRQVPDGRVRGPTGDRENWREHRFVRQPIGGRLDHDLSVEVLDVPFHNQPVNRLGEPDLQITRLVESTDGVGVLRDADSLVRVHSPVGTLRQQSRKWFRVPAIADAVRRVLLAAPQASFKPLRALLEFAFFVLSPRRIGATLIWMLSDRVPYENLDIRALQLSVSPLSWAASVVRRGEPFGAVRRCDIDIHQWQPRRHRHSLESEQRRRTARVESTGYAPHVGEAHLFRPI